jgi:hypothetical protein
MAGRLPDDAVALFRVRPEGFVVARDELVSELRAQGRDEDAASVKALRKPTLALWALNQLADRDPEGVGELLDAGRELRAAQQAATSGRGADRFREATAARRRAIARLLQVATAAVAEVGGGGGHTDAIGPALEAASADDEPGRLLAAGAFRKLPTAPSGFGNVFGLEAVPGVGSLAKDEAETDDGGGLAAIEEEHERRRGALEAASATAVQQREEVDRLEAEVAAVRARLQELEHELAAAGASARAAELERKRAERDLAKVTARLDRARRTER